MIPCPNCVKSHYVNRAIKAIKLTVIEVFLIFYCIKHEYLTGGLSNATPTSCSLSEIKMHMTDVKSTIRDKRQHHQIFHVPISIF